MPHEKEAKHTLGGMAAGASIGAIAAGPGGAFVGGVIGGLVGLAQDQENQENQR